MGWETRKGNQYYYFVRRVGSRVVKQYIGSASKEFVNSIAVLDGLGNQTIRDARRYKAACAESAEAPFKATAEAVSAFYAEVQQVTDALIVANGYHRHKRGEWRRKRMSSDLQAASDDLHRGLPRRDFGGLTTFQGGAACIKRYLADRYSKDEQQQDYFLRELTQIEVAAAGPNPSPLESLLAERVAACYGHVLLCERGCYNTELAQSRTAASLSFASSRLEAAQRRYLAAIKTLAQVRRLKLPIMQIALPGSTQINVGEKQINMGHQQVNVAAGG